MQGINGSGRKMVKGWFWAIVFLAAVTMVVSAYSIPEQGKLSLFGAVLVMAAFWGKKPPCSKR